MKLKWSAMKEPTFWALGYFEYKRKSAFTEGIRPVYNQYRQSVRPRQPAPGPATTTFNASKDQWDDLALALCSEKQSNSSINLMYGKGNQSVFDRTPPPGTPIDAVQYNVASLTPACSRLNLVVRPECCGHALRTKVSFILARQWRTVIQQWKVMSPTLGAEGTESAVIYLRVPLDDAKVTGLITELSEELRQELQELNSCPFGLINMARGIYGCELLAIEKETPTSGITSQGSAGDLMSMIICKAAWQTAEDIFHGPTKRKTTEAEEERLLKSQLARVLQDIEWELEN
jgi:hypothetical protein